MIDARKEEKLLHLFFCVTFLISMLVKIRSLLRALRGEGFCSLRPQSGAHSAGPKVYFVLLRFHSAKRKRNNNSL